MNVSDLLDGTSKLRVLVLGDLILDRYTWGNVERVSPEAPVLVLRADEHELRPGGAASVALLLRHLEAEVTLAGVVGDDAAGRSLRKLLDDDCINHDFVATADDRPTTTKERFIGRAANRHSHQILRVDHETRDAISSGLEARLCSQLVRRISEHAAVIISDYAKGVCTPELLKAVIHTARNHNIPVVVDPARITDYGRYRRASLITPNREEAGLAAGIRIESPADALEAGRILVERTSLAGAFITIDRDGIAVVGCLDDQSSQHIEPATTREVYDITGAGDMVVAVTGLCQAARLPLDETARIANAAAGLEIEQLGIAPVTWDQITERYAAAANVSVATADLLQDRRQTVRAASKIATLSRLAQHVAEHRTDGKTIVLTNGCFDLLHVGHVAYLEEAAALGDVLIVAINCDAGVRRLKGPQRPVIGQSDRAAMLASLACVDHVLIFDEATPHRLLDCLRPDILVKGGTTTEVVGREVVEAYGGKVYTTDIVGASSTTRIVESIAQTNQQHERNRAVNA